MELQEALWQEALRNLAKAQKNLDTIQRDIKELGDRFATSSRRDLRGVMTALQDADATMAQVEAVRWAKENQR
jgi:flagellar hook-basal body complex protein FliE